MKSKLFKIASIIAGSLLGIILAGFAVYVYLYYPRKADTFEFKTPHPINNILIATQSTDFKNTLVKQLCDSLKNSSVYIKGVDVSNLPDLDENNWDRILIISTYIISLDNIVDRFITDTGQPDKFLLFVTSGGADWQPEPELQIDAITSASGDEYTDDLVRLILDWLRSDSITDWEPYDYLLALKFFLRVDVHKACMSIFHNKERYEKSFSNLVSLINQIGYQYLRLKQFKSAQEIFKLNVSLFPDHWNVYDSYGEALLINGETEEAASYYRKALELNPTSESIKEILTELENN